MDTIIELLKTIVLGIIEGVTEWLPISSSGHMILADEFLKLKVSEEFWSMFLVVIQLGAIFAVLVLFFNKLNPWSKRKTDIQKKQTFSLWAKVLVACLPAAIIGLLLDDFLDAHLSTPFIVALMLIIYGVFFILIENRNRNKTPKISSFAELDYKTALIIGGFQILSLIPGTSRSGATILGAILIGCSRYVAAEFSFFLAIPVMFGASGLRAAKYVAKGAPGMSGFNFVILLLGMAVAFVVSMLAIKFLMNFIKKHDFKPFGYYRIALGIVVILYFLLAGKPIFA